MPVLENDTAAVPMAKEFSAENKEPVVPGPEDNKDTKDTKDTKEIKENKDNKETSSKESLLSGDKKVLASSLTTIGILSPLPNPPPSLAKVSNNVNNELLKGNSSNIKEILKAQANLEHFIISYIVVGGKVTKLQVCGASNVTLMEVNLKKWEERA